MDPRSILRGYFHAKDENRPHLLRDVFAEDAELETVNKTSTISFPTAIHGRESIGEVMVRRFNQAHENIYSFYMDSPREEAVRFSCDWLVGMTEKDGRNVRVGCGRYDWAFQAKPPHLASRLVITIEVMQVLAPGQGEAVLAWLRRLDYPWSSPADVARPAPEIEALRPVLDYLGRGRLA